MSARICLPSIARFSMNAFVEKHGLHSVVDRVFDSADAPAAFDCVDNGSYLGNTVIRL